MSKLIKFVFGGLGAVGGKVGKIALSLALIGVGAVTGNFQLIAAGLALAGSALRPTPKGREREASAATLQVGEYPRTAVFGRAAVSGSLVDAFNYGGTYGTDWELLVIALADHRCDALEGFYVNDTYVAFAGDGDVAGYNSQLKVWWRSGTEAQALPSVVTTNGPGWTADDNGAGVCYAVVAYKADPADSQTPIWTGGRPRFLFILRGALCYDPRKDSTVAGGSGAHRWATPATWEWTENPIVSRYNWARGLFACDRIAQPEQLLVGRGLSTTEAPPTNLAWRANLCDEVVGGAARFRIGGLVAATETYLSVEEDFAAACAGTIVQPEGAVEIDPGEARAPSFAFTDADLIVGSKVRWQDFLGTGDAEWVNTVVPSYIEPAHKWGPHAAPIRRDIADVTADRGSRELGLNLGLVTNAAQAGRVGEVHRRLGRLTGRGQVTLPPRFAGIEEGDWGTWQSDRYFGGATRTLRVDAWGSDQGWRHQITFRQISSSCYSDTAPLSDGAVATLQGARAAIAAPGGGSWTLAAGYSGSGTGNTRSPALIVTGASDNTLARFVRIEFVQSATAPTGATVWTDDGVTGPEVVRREIDVGSGATYYAAVSYVVDGVQGPRLVLGPVTTASATIDFGNVNGGGRPDNNATLGDNLALNASLADAVRNLWNGTATRIVGNPASNEPAVFARSTSPDGHGGNFNGGGLIEIAAGETIYCSGKVWDATPAGNNFWRFNPFFYKADGLTFNGQATVDLFANSAAPAIRRGTFVAPAGTAFMIVYDYGYVNTGANVNFAEPRFARTELQADVTLTAAVVADLAISTKSVNADYTGALLGSPLPVTFSPTVNRSGASVKLDNAATYAITKPSDGSAGADGGTAAVDNTNGSSTKGDVSVSAFATGSIQVKFRLTVSYSAITVGVFDCILNKVVGDPPSGGSGGGGSKLATVPANQDTSGTSYVAASSASNPTLVLASGESLYATMTAGYSAGAGTGNRYGTFKHRYSTDNATWTDFGAAGSGTNASPERWVSGEYYEGVNGSVTHNQSVSGPSAGTYYLQTIFASSASGKSVVLDGSSITYEAKT